MSSSSNSGSGTSSGPRPVFSHPAARLVKTIPPLQPPQRVNGSVPIDSLGSGNLAPTDVILADAYGPLQISVVPDPFNPSINTIVLSVGFDNQQLGAARRFVLPFRSYELDATGQLVTKSKVKGFNPTTRPIYHGLGAGTHGVHGGSFWFFEDIGEDGAADRQRWENDRVGRRAIWTVWLLSAPAPVVQHAQHILDRFPQPIPSLPPIFDRPAGFPWADTYAALPPSPLAHAPKSKRPLPPVPVKPESLRSIPIASTAAQEPPVAGEPPAPAPDQSKEAEQDQVHEQQQSATPRPSQLRVSSHLKDGSQQIDIQGAPSVTLRNLSSRPPMSDYRNSLVAVDNETGQIIGVLATDVHLDSDHLASPSSPSTTSDGDAEHEAVTPSDELATQPVLLAVEKSAPPTPRASTIIRPASVYRDLDHDRPPSRVASVLRDDTFAPPPLPGKDGNESPSARTSVASAAFFSAAEYETEDEEARALRDNFVSIDGHHAEPHRPDLLHDDDNDDDDARSDASGSTIGGAIVQLWRKARGKTRGAGKTLPPEPPSKVTPRPPRQASEASDRTSRAETAAESFSDEDSDPPSPDDNDDAEAQAAEAGDTPTELGAPVQHSHGHGHCPRSQLRTEDVRTIEDKIWREALESGDLPIDAPYTHLAARGLADSCALSSFMANNREVQSFELSAPGEAPLSKESRSRKPKQVHDYMQGGTVLIEFLAGSTRIGASLIRSAGLDAAAAQGPETPAAAASIAKSNGMLSLVPVVPQHLMRFFGVQTAVTATSSALKTSANGGYALITSLWTDATDWVGSWFSSSTSPAPESDAKIESERRETDSEEWEYAIPDFDPNSLASTPRPVYRRKRPIPSARNGFNVPGNAGASAIASDSAPPNRVHAAAAAASPPKQQVPLPSEIRPEGQRYSVLHIDGLGIGRRTFLRGHPEIEGHLF